MLQRIELEVLVTIERGDTISEFATKLDHSESYLSCAVGDLVEKGLVYTERDGRPSFSPRSSPKQRRFYPTDSALLKPSSRLAIS